VLGCGFHSVIGLLPARSLEEGLMRIITGMLSAVLLCYPSATTTAQKVVASTNQQPPEWHDPSPHTVQFITVEKDVKLEVLDWGGSGRPLVLLAGLGDTAHVFDEFAPKLASEYHVYGVTRRGYGASSVPAVGGAAYTADRLGDDVLAVLDALKIERPVLVGHSIAGEELSSVATRHPERVAGLIYLDAGYGYAYYDPVRGDYSIDSEDLRRKLEQMRAGSADPMQLIQGLLQTDLPRFERDLQGMEADIKSYPSPPPAPAAADRETFEAWRTWEKRMIGFAVPEGELHQLFESTPDGHVGEPRTGPSIPQAVIAGEQKYANIRLPALAIFAVPHDQGRYLDSNSTARLAAEAGDAAKTEAQAKAFESGVPSARVVRLPHAGHYVFLTNEADVLREMRAFVSSLL
jgi:pimeloyl-ACP methyl ester carboxylesterase